MYFIYTVKIAYARKEIKSHNGEAAQLNLIRKNLKRKRPEGPDENPRPQSSADENPRPQQSSDLLLIFLLQVQKATASNRISQLESEVSLQNVTASNRTSQLESEASLQKATASNRISQLESEVSFSD